jgi:hypothetical protein
MRRSHLGTILLNLCYFGIIWFRVATLLLHFTTSLLLQRHLNTFQYIPDMKNIKEEQKTREDKEEDFKEMRGYWELKEEALNCTVWRTRFERLYGAVVKQAKGWWWWWWWWWYTWYLRNLGKSSVIFHLLRTFSYTFLWPFEHRTCL